MIPTLQIQDALLAALRGAKIVEKVMAHAEPDLGAALAHLRDNPSSIAVVVPGLDEFDHVFEDGTNVPARTEIRSHFDILVSGRQLDQRETGDPRTLSLKDSVIALLLWSDLGIDHLVALPSACEPLAIEFENGKGREAWKLSVEFRQTSDS